MKQVENSLNIQLNQSVREISALRESQKLTRQYRHDLRHHLQYLLTCLENDKQEQAKEYISEICREIEGQKVIRYCEIETVNLIISSFEGRATEEGIRMNIRGTLPEAVPIAERDLCVLISNALENALHACRAFADADEESTIDVQIYEKENRIFIQVTNPCKQKVRFDNGIPVSEKEGHGIGTQSICAIVERYNGVYSFLEKEGRFILRLYL